MREPTSFINVKPEHIHDNVLCVSQINEYYCGPACVQMILHKYHMTVSQDDLAHLMETHHDHGTHESDLIAGIESYGLRVTRPQTEYEAFTDILTGASAILSIRAWGFGHYALLIGGSARKWYLADPVTETGLGWLTRTELRNRITSPPIVVRGEARYRRKLTLPAQRIPE